MKQIICPKKGIKLAQEKDCNCDTFKVFKNKAGEAVIECAKCGTRYDFKTIS